MKTIFESITTYFQADGWPIHQIEGATAYSMKFQGKNGTWTCIAQADETARQFVFYSACPVKATSETYQSLAELLARINYSLLLGNFEMSFLNGDIRFRTSIEVPGHDLGAFMIERMTYSNVANMDMYLPAIMDIIQNNVSPLDAIHNVLTSSSMT